MLRYLCQVLCAPVQVVIVISQNTKSNQTRFGYTEFQLLPTIFFVLILINQMSLL